MHYISDTNILNLMEALNKDYNVYVPVKKGNQHFYKRFTGKDGIGDIVIGEVRAFEPLKPFFFSAREKVAEGFKPDAPAPQDKPFAIAGVKACDLAGFKVQDFVFGDKECEDLFYMRRRRENLIISADCTCAIATCFCLALGIKPYPTGEFDINLSRIRGGFVAESGSPKGKDIIEKYSYLFQKATPSHIYERDTQREKLIKEVEQNLINNNVPHKEKLDGKVEKKFESAIWKDEAKTCVECGACNTVCPTCHCFLLYDQKDKDYMARLKIWDSCLIKDFARVAGGANPRPKLWMRLRNRFEKKFDFFPKVAGVYACTGCGRCILACPAKIDIRRIMKNLASDE